MRLKSADIYVGEYIDLYGRIIPRNQVVFVFPESGKYAPLAYWIDYYRRHGSPLSRAIIDCLGKYRYCLVLTSDEIELLANGSMSN